MATYVLPSRIPFSIWIDLATDSALIARALALGLIGQSCVRPGNGASRKDRFLRGLSASANGEGRTPSRGLGDHGIAATTNHRNTRSAATAYPFLRDRRRRFI